MPRARPTRSPIVRVLNRDVRRYHRWCTPSILEDQERVEDFYGSDVSISAGFFGTLVDHTGVFGEAERFAASVQGADYTIEEGALIFKRELRKDRIAKWRWFLGAWGVGTYRQDDSVDVRYERPDGTPAVAEKLDIELVR